MKIGKMLAKQKGIIKTNKERILELTKLHPFKVFEAMASLDTKTREQLKWVVLNS